MDLRERRMWIWGASMMALAIILGAFGAHALRDYATPEGLAWWETGADYHRVHALGLLLVASLYPRVPPSAQCGLLRSSRLILVGVLLFSGSLYTMALTGVRWLGAVTPIGGTLWIIAWVHLAVYVFLKIPER